MKIKLNRFFFLNSISFFKLIFIIKLDIDFFKTGLDYLVILVTLLD